MPMVKRSMSSRAKFSFGSEALLELASNQINMAGSCATSSVSAAKSPAPWFRKIWFWPYMNAAYRTLEMAVGKCPWSTSVSFSLSGFVVATMRPSHQAPRATYSWRNWASRARRAAASRERRRNRESGGLSVGSGTASAPASGAPRPPTSLVTVASNPAAVAAVSSSGRAPKPARR